MESTNEPLEIDNADVEFACKRCDRLLGRRSVSTMLGTDSELLAAGHAPVEVLNVLFTDPKVRAVTHEARRPRDHRFTSAMGMHVTLTGAATWGAEAHEGRLIIHMRCGCGSNPSVAAAKLLQLVADQGPEPGARLRVLVPS